MFVLLRRLCAVLAVAVATSLPAQPTSLAYHGCDGTRSCHLITMQLMPFPPNSYPFAIWQVRFTGTFMQRGGYNDIGGHDNGTVWYPSNTVGLYSQGDDAHHGPGQCNVQYRGDFYFQQLCLGPTNSFDTQLRAAHGWQPGTIKVNLLYADTFYDEAVKPTATLRLTTVPEPASIALVVFGLAGIAVRRRRWGR